MTKEEFYKKLQEYGINLDAYQIAIGYKTDEMYYRGIYKDNGKWVAYRVGDRNRVSTSYKENEKDAYQYIYNALLVDIRRAGLVNQSITEDVIQTSKSYVCDFLQKKYSISKSDAEDTWNYLLYDFHVLNEIKYFALNNKFVPKDDCYRVHGYSAYDISDKLDLNAIDAFKYLIKLEKEPDKYLNNVESLNLNDYKKEFLKRMHELGINLGKYQIVVDKYMPVSYYLGVYKKDKEWIIYEVGERDQVTDLYRNYSEDKIFDDFYRNVFGRLDMMGFINQSITPKVIETPKSYVCDFLQKKYNISKLDAEDTWNYLVYDFHVLNEVKYFTLNNKFVPKDDCYRVEGYSAQDIYEKTYLTEIGAYNYLIYLEKHPEQALKDLNNGLPRK